MKRFALLGAIAALLVMAGNLLFASAASAHERRTVKDFTFVVGWVNEPHCSTSPTLSTCASRGPPTTCRSPALRRR